LFDPSDQMLKHYKNKMVLAERPLAVLTTEED